MRSWLDVRVNSVLLGQLLSLAVTVTGVVSTGLAQVDASVPFTQSASYYTLLFIVFGGPVRVFNWNWEQQAWKYVLLAGIDVVSTWCVVKAFSLTSITSVTLLDSWSIPCVIILTAVFFKQRYSTRQILSAALAVSGLATLLLFDSSSHAGSQSVTLQGDMLVIIGATGYGVSNVLSEHILKTGDPAEFLAGLGTFGLLASCITVPVFERGTLAGAPWTVEMFLLLATYAVAMTLFSLGMLVMLHKSGSTFFNLSLLTSDFYAFAVRTALLQGFTRSSLTVYMISTSLVVIGLVMYFTRPPEPPSHGPPGARPAQPLHTAAVPSPASESVPRRDHVLHTAPVALPVVHAPRSPCIPGEQESAQEALAGAHAHLHFEYSTPRLGHAHCCHSGQHTATAATESKLEALQVSDLEAQAAVCGSSAQPANLESGSPSQDSKQGGSCRGFSTPAGVSLEGSCSEKVAMRAAKYAEGCCQSEQDSPLGAREALWAESLSKTRQVPSRGT